MAQFFTDFSEYTIGQQPSDWTIQWATAGRTYTVKDVVGATGGKVLEATESTTNRSVFTWNKVGSVQDVEVLVKMRMTQYTSSNPLNLFRVFTRVSGSSGSENAYFGAPSNGTIGGAFISDSQTAINKYINGASSSVMTVSSSPDLNIQLNEWIWCRFRCVGSQLSCKVWKDGDVEPSFKLGNDSSLTSGLVGIAPTSGGNTIEYDIFSVGTNGDSAPSSGGSTTTPVTIQVDTKRQIQSNTSVLTDTARNATYFIPTTINLDTWRILKNSTVVNADLKRQIESNIAAMADAKRGLTNAANVNADSKRQVANTQGASGDSDRIVTNTANVNADSKRSLMNTLAFSMDSIRKTLKIVSFQGDLIREVHNGALVGLDSLRKIVISHNVNLDVTRKIYSAISVMADTLRNIVGQAQEIVMVDVIRKIRIDHSITSDSKRVIQVTTQVILDMLRSLKNLVDFGGDTKRNLKVMSETANDSDRKLLADIAISPKTSRKPTNVIESLIDTAREIVNIFLKRGSAYLVKEVKSIFHFKELADKYLLAEIPLNLRTKELADKYLLAEIPLNLSTKELPEAYEWKESNRMYQFKLGEEKEVGIEVLAKDNSEFLLSASWEYNGESGTASVENHKAFIILKPTTRGNEKCTFTVTITPNGGALQQILIYPVQINVT